MIDYNDNVTKSKDEDVLDENVISEYFTRIFQAERLEKNPTVADVRDLLSGYNNYVPVLDDDFTLDELDVAIEKNGNGVGIDCMDKRISLLFTTKLRLAVLAFFNVIFNTKYPDEWKKQLLRPEKKKGHTTKEPKLRGVAISQLLPTLYDTMLFNRFNLWYKKNFEQAGFCEKQGCLLQIFSIYVTMEQFKAQNKSLYVGFLDYEKAFDYVSRGNILKHLTEKGAGSKFINAVASMYETTSYVPRLCNRIGDAIIAKHGVTQGRRTSTSFFSFEVQDMGKSVYNPESIIEYNLLQLADDSALFAEDRFFMKAAFERCLAFSAENFLGANVDKTVFLHLIENGDIDPIAIGEALIKAAINDEYIYLGMLFIASNDIIKHIRKNLSHRKFHIAKFFEWLSVNESTPVKIKLQVLYTCLFSAYLYGAETWWKIDDVADEILLEERKLLRACLCGKGKTPDDFLYLEIDGCDIIASIKHRQRSFFQNLLQLTPEEVVSRRIVDMNRNLPICTYYDNLDENICDVNKTNRITRSSEATGTYSTRYHTLIDPKYNHILYESFLPEHCRIVITRWRLSCHNLRIETGRRPPKLPQHLRVCINCNEVEDENHVIFSCELYTDIRVRFGDYLQKYPCVTKVLNPNNVDDACVLGALLNDIEKRRSDLGLQ